MQRLIKERELSEALVQVIKDCYDIDLFTSMFFAHVKKKIDRDWAEVNVDTPYYHYEIRDSLAGTKDSNIIVARWHGKTTCIWIYFIRSLIYCPEDTILYVASATLWEEVIGKIMREFENNARLVEVYGNLVPANSDDVKDKRLKKWRSKKLELLNWGDIMTVSKWQSVRGKRRRLVVLDDPQENKEVRNKRVVDRFNERVFSSLYNTMMPWGRMIVVGTIIGNMCLVKYLRDELKRRTVEYKAIEGWKPIRPEMRSMEELEERKKSIWTALFNQEFMNIPYSYEERVISESWIRYWAENINIDDLDYRILSIDPAISQKTSADYIGICAIWHYEQDRVLLYSAQKKMTMEALTDMIVEMHAKYKFNEIRVESIAFQQMLRAMLSKRWLPVVQVTPHKDKYTRLMEVAHHLEFWKVLFRRIWDEELIYQLTNFPDVEHDDIMDAFVYCLMPKQASFKMVSI